MKKIFKNKKILIIAIIIFLLSILIILRLNEDDWICENGDWIKHSNPDTSKPIENCSVKENNSIHVYDPIKGQTINSPLTIKGDAIGSWYFEGTFPIFLYNDKGEELASGVARATNDWMSEEQVPFETVLNFSVPDTERGTLIFKKDNPSGLSENNDKISIPIKFSDKTKMVKLYYYNKTEDEKKFGYVACSEESVLPVERKIFLTSTPIQDTINLLLQGNIFDSEKQSGFSSEFPIDGLILIGANLKDGILTLEFSDSLNKTNGGSCRVGLLRTQIEKTAGQFDGVKEVKLIPEYIFQP